MIYREQKKIRRTAIQISTAANPKTSPNTNKQKQEQERYNMTNFLHQNTTNTKYISGKEKGKNETLEATMWIIYPSGRQTGPSPGKSLQDERKPQSSTCYLPEKERTAEIEKKRTSGFLPKEKRSG